MKKTHFKIGLLTACLISVGSIANAQSCGAESCDSGTCKCSKRNCDDKGLLEVINNAASNFEAKLASMIPDRGVGARTHCSCDKCSAVAAQHYEVASPHPSSSSSMPHIAPPVAQPDVTRPPVHPPVPRMAPQNTIESVPAPNSGPHEVVPLPDSRVNPFKDDPIPTSRNLKPVPVRSGSYLRTGNRLETDFDPQASNYSAKQSALITKAASRTIIDTSNGLAKTSSTRRVQSQSNNSVSDTESSYFDRIAPEVVPASLSTPVSNLRRLPSIPPADDQFVNPLRAQ